MKKQELEILKAAHELEQYCNDQQYIGNCDGGCIFNVDRLGHDICTAYEPHTWDLPDMPSVAPDPVHHPEHYTDGGIETIDYMRAKLTPEEFVGYLRGNAMKYLSRAGKKGDVVEDLKKCEWYLNRLIKELEEAE
ncbi:DUF3310 domain-containing protein [Anaerovorax odorimutans]|uniref:DUF3310 domain-containing protein n=1 Tax=Anaerovorax odorimutans TaxID=109327 RepID=A0ABT1RUQ6_9FIRM|nr:DUF3310 domain-containing protein [Anaerovorax odorimutans]MCQ4638606.1 DUF3310 domain-containing protein [Anaerovorax odorimutans]